MFRLLPGSWRPPLRGPGPGVARNAASVIVVSSRIQQLGSQACCWSLRWPSSRGLCAAKKRARARHFPSERRRCQGGFLEAGRRRLGRPHHVDQSTKERRPSGAPTSVGSRRVHGRARADVRPKIPAKSPIGPSNLRPSGRDILTFQNFGAGAGRFARVAPKIPTRIPSEPLDL